MLEFTEKAKEVLDLLENNQTDKQLGIGDYKPKLPKCCQNCSNNTQPFCNCAMPAMEMMYESNEFLQTSLKKILEENLC